LFTDMKTDLNYTYFMISRILSQANAALSLAFSKLIFSGDLTEGQAEKLEKEASFDPLKSNVIFASSHSNWAFTLDHFSGVFAQALGGANPEKAKQFLWGDFYLNPKDKKILKKPINEGQHNTFTQFILKNIGNIYTSILEEKDKAKLEKITKVLKIELPASVSSRLESEPGLVALVNVN
jgi:ribosome assembly protein 1